MPFINKTSINVTVVSNSGSIREQVIPTDWIMSHKQGVVLCFKTPGMPFRIPLAEIQKQLRLKPNMGVSIYSNDIETFWISQAQLDDYLEV